MFERFTSRARHAIVLAQEEARQLRHNYIGTEHILLGLLAEPEGFAAQALDRFGISLAVARDDVKRIIGLGKGQVSGHIPFTPRAKKTLELALREALGLHHNYIGTEHILLGVIREGQGVAAQILRERADLLAIRSAVLDLVPAGQPQVKGRLWLRRLARVMSGEAEGPGGGPAEEESTAMRTTPAADASLNEAARLAGPHPVGSHHLLLAALADPDTAAARALASLGVDLDRAREALRTAEVTGTSDEPPEEAGRRQMLVRVTDDRVTVEAGDQEIIRAGRAALAAPGDRAEPGGTIRGDLAVSASVGGAWQALRDSLDDIRRRASVPVAPPEAGAGQDQPGTDAG